METTFIGSFEIMSQLPTTKKFEFAFMGRSNVGKSSFINALTGRKLAHVSSTPGKTQHFNYYLIDDSWYLVDLPGYGYAKRPKHLREAWEVEMWRYLRQRETLLCIFVLVDINVPPQKNDITFIQDLGEAGVPFAIIFTKTDRQSATRNEASLNVYKETLSEMWETLPTYFMTSSERKTGRDEVMKFILEVLKGAGKTK